MAVSNIDTHMRNACGVCIFKKYQITWFQISFGNKGAVLILCLCGTIQGDTVLLEYIVNKTGTVKSRRRSTCPYIWHANILFCRSNNGGCGAGVIFQHRSTDRCAGGFSTPEKQG